MARRASLFFPFVLIALGVLWLLSNLGVFPPTNFRILLVLWPVLIIALGLGLILKHRWSLVWDIVSLLLIVCMALAVVFAPQLRLMDLSGDISWLPHIQLSGNVVTQERVVKDFSAVVIEYPSEVIIQQGTEEKLTLEGDENLLQYLRTSVKGKTLEIDSVPGIRFNWNITGSQVKIVITVKDLTSLDFSTAGKVALTGLNTNSLKLRISGAGDVNLSELNLESLDCTLSGAGRIDADGTTQNFLLTISGFGDFKGKLLQSQNAEIHISGAGSADVWAVKTLDVFISGAGSVNYLGNPVVKESISGAGKITRIDE